MQSEPLTASAGAGRQTPRPFSLVIFGASGDLTRRKLVPAIFSLYSKGLLPAHFSIVGFARSPMTDREFAETMREACSEFGKTAITPPQWEAFGAQLNYVRGDYGDIESFRALDSRLRELAGTQNRPDNRMYDLATPPDVFEDVVQNLSDCGMSCPGDKGEWRRIVIEKPFGRDLATARELNRALKVAFQEDQIFRIDHYLGKEAVQNILVFRFANTIFDPLWNQKYIDHVQITVGEEIGVEGRGGFYDKTGALRDIVQNHMMHLLCFLAMESPVEVSADSIRDEKVKVLKSLRRIPFACAANGVIRAQYAAGEVNGKKVPGYREENNVPRDSRTETFVAFKALIDNWRWAGVPFYLRTGKRLPSRLSEISVHFKDVPRVLFNAGSAPLPNNVIVLRIQPNEGIYLRFQVKAPGLSMRIEPQQMDFGYGKAFGNQPSEAYERLLLDAAIGDSTLFIRSDEVEAAWEFVNPIIEGCSQDMGSPLPEYPAGSWGPREAFEMIESDGRRWDYTPE